MTTIGISEHATPLGTMWATWTVGGLYRLDWNQPDDVAGEATVTTDTTDFDKQLSAYFREGTEPLEGIKLDTAGWTDFTQRVYENCRKIPAGETVTYRELAAMAGNQKASRAVGAAMAKNRTLLVIPCHRVIAADGSLRGFSAAGGLVTKQRLLELEQPNGLFA
ncbi:methylated-DNA--[protein]-cysteine S-methyltransferase [Rubripirellula reticaptiva]|uniref:methylated-DNA--[protein]-cysteine S-methyltransferase n=1 Tax=Rubripirellula reticaptiva TaxID=2528013 RepID=A0A5C6F4X2_9BACT|nr:methylated-DNA--[protein]-cysteine S-methyltransferase [Rubripirellula reticaptiva]TWU55106.1 Methylated-DNA--protein-cysteine methyltransferase [Rubripirellula reticaptiva]